MANASGVILSLKSMNMAIKQTPPCDPLKNVPSKVIIHFLVIINSSIHGSRHTKHEYKWPSIYVIIRLFSHNCERIFIMIKFRLVLILPLLFS